MEGSQMTINIIFPVLNEELRLENGIKQTLKYIKRYLPEHEILLTIIDNGSTDNTYDIGQRLCKKYSNVNYIKILERGVGIAFKTGVLSTTCEIVGYMDIDLSTDLKHLKEMIDIFSKYPKVQIVNASRYSRNSVLIGRKWYRNVISYILVFILKIVFHMRATDAICGFKFFRTNCVKELIDISSSEPGWFYLIEMLIRAERMGICIKEIPVKWVYEEHTKVHVIKVTKNYLFHIWKLYQEFNSRKCKEGFNKRINR